MEGETQPVDNCQGGGGGGGGGTGYTPCNTDNDPTCPLPTQCQVTCDFSCNVTCPLLYTCAGTCPGEWTCYPSACPC